MDQGAGDLGPAGLAARQRRDLAVQPVRQPDLRQNLGSADQRLPPRDAVQRRVMGRRMFQLTRGLSDEEWADALERLARRGLVEVDGDTHRLTDAGYALYQHIEDRTDEVSGAGLHARLGELIERTRPFVKPILDAGVLPGTRKKG